MLEAIINNFKALGHAPRAAPRASEVQHCSRPQEVALKAFEVQPWSHP